MKMKNELTGARTVRLSTATTIMTKPKMSFRGILRRGKNIGKDSYEGTLAI